MMKTLKTVCLAAMTIWATAAAADNAALLARGKQVFDHSCVACHGTGERMAGTASLAVKYSDGSIPAALQERSDMSPDFIRFFVRNGVMIMPAFRKTEITDADLNALTTYLSTPKK